MKKITGSEAVIKSLLAEGVEHIFGYPGGAIMPIYDALFGYKDQIEHILVRHEQCAAHAAQGYSRVSDRVGVCFATSGPGATNLVTGITDAYADSSPLVCITGQVTSELIGTNAFQETDIIGITTPITKWNCQISEPKEIPKIIAQAFFIANSGRKGPVLIDITKDAQFGALEFEYQKCTSHSTYIPKPEINQSKIEEALRLIENAKKPFIVYGQGVLLSDSINEFRAFVEKSGIPSAWTILGHTALPTNHPLNVGMLGMHGNYGPNYLSAEADLIIAIGMRFDDRVTGDAKTYGKNAKKIHIDIDHSEINKTVTVDVPIIADAKEVLETLTKKIEKRSYPDWKKKFDDCYQKEFNKVIKHEISPEEGKITMAEIISSINTFTDGNAIVTTDVGQHQMVTIRYTNFNIPKTLVTSGGLGTMGFGLPAAIGAKIAKSDLEVVSINGDGGIQMSINEFATIFQEKLNIKIFILNNNFLGMVRQWQELFFEKRYSSVEIVNPDFVKVAEGFRLNSVKIEKREDLMPTLKKVFETPETFIVEVLVEKEENVFPMVPSGAPVSDVRLE